MEQKRFYQFGPYLLDVHRRELRRQGRLVPLPPTAFKLLAALIQHREQEIISREELIRAAWGNDRVEERTLTVHISAVRDALGGAVEARRYMLTTRNMGYSFIGEVRELSEEEAQTLLKDYAKSQQEEWNTPDIPQAKEQYTTLSVAAPSLGPSAPTAHVDGAAPKHPAVSAMEAGRAATIFRGHLRLAVGVVVAIILLGSGWYLGHNEESKPQFQLQQLTTNPSEIPLTATAISPDGKYIAYANEEGICVQVVETGEMHVLPPPESGTIYRLSWFPDSMKLLASLQDAQDDGSAIWELSIFGGTPRKLNDGAGEAAVSPDGSRIAFVSENGEEMWLEGPDGEDTHRIFAGGEDDTFHELAWGPQGRQILFGRIQVRSFITNVSIQSIDLENGRISTIASGSGLRGMCASPDGKIIYSREDAPPNQNTVNLWQIKFNYRTGKVARAARRITSWPGSCIYSLSLTADGKCLAFLKGPYQANVYVADVKGNGTQLQNSRLLTLDDADDLPTAWTRDGKAVLFHSDRYGKWQIFEQAIGQRSAELIASDQEDDKGARVTPDGKSLLYFARPKYKIFQSAAPTRLIITPLAGGPSRLILSERGVYSVRCSRLPADLCVLGERGLTNHQLVFYALDPLHGKGNQLSTTHVDLPIDQTNWDLSSDGSQIAVALGGEPDGHIRIISLQGGHAHELTIKGRSGFQSMDWSADGKGVYVSSRTSWGADLLHVDMHGHATVLRQQIGSYETWAVPSPDGKHLAFLEWTASGKVWMLKGF